MTFSSGKVFTLLNKICSSNKCYSELSIQRILKKWMYQSFKDIKQHKHWL